MNTNNKEQEESWEENKIKKYIQLQGIAQEAPKQQRKKNRSRKVEERRYK